MIFSAGMSVAGHSNVLEHAQGDFHRPRFPQLSCRLSMPMVIDMGSSRLQNGRGWTTITNRGPTRINAAQVAAGRRSRDRFQCENGPAHSGAGLKASAQFSQNIVGQEATKWPGDSGPCVCAGSAPRRPRFSSAAESMQRGRNSFAKAIPPPSTERGPKACVP